MAECERQRRSYLVPFRAFVFMAVLSVPVAPGVADDLLYRYEGDVVPYDESAGWLDGRCEDPCSESVEDGHFVLRWPEAGDLANYTYIISNDLGEPPLPETLWVEWRFRSNHPLGPNFYTCDANFKVRYREVFDLIFIYGDAAISFSGDGFIGGLDINEFHTYRFESLDGAHYQFSADGNVFIDAADAKASGGAFLQLAGRGGCISDQIPNMINEWDFVRYGTISYGEEIIASAPPAGFLNARVHPALDRFTVTFDEPNYVYLDEITVEATGGVATAVIQTRRRENDGPETVEIVLDAPIPMGETTRFTFDDGVAVNVIEYTFAPGDTDGTGRVDLRDVAAFQTCFGSEVFSGPCQACDLFRNELMGP
jgi:hypothetical protein